MALFGFASRAPRLLLPGLIALLFLLRPAAADQVLPFHHAFDRVWRTVNENYFDPGFGGHDWNALGVEHRNRLTAETDRAGFVDIVNDMLFTLDRSHLVVVPGEVIWRYVPEVFAAGSPGLVVRVVDNSVIVTAVHAGSNAAADDIAVGDRIDAIDGTACADIIATAEAKPYPPFNPRHRAAIVVRALHAALFGPADTDVSVALTSADGHERTVTLHRAARWQIASDDTPLPSYALEFESRVLAGGIAYLRFNYFVTPLVPKFFAALYATAGPAGAIIDLRDNPGGFLRPMSLLATRLVLERTPFYRIRTRDHEIDQPLPGVADAYAGPVAILVDETTLSAAELYAGALQALGRATIVGSRTPGFLLGARWEPLPRGLALMYAFGEPRLPDGTVLEGRGVMPDIVVAHDRASLAAGRDAPLDAAIAHLQSIRPAQ